MKSQEMNHTLTIVNKWCQCVTFSYTTRKGRELLSYPHLRERRERRRSNSYPRNNVTSIFCYHATAKEQKKCAHTRKIRARTQD